MHNNSRVQNYITESNFMELQKARQDLIGEIEAIIQYDNHINTATNNMARETWMNIKQEELVHMGELLGLITYLDSSQQAFIQDGLNEFNNRLSGNNSNNYAS